MGEERKVYKVLVGKPEGKRHWEDEGAGGKMGSEWILGRLAWGMWIVSEAVLGIGNIGFCLGPRAFRGLASIV
jgi:hypothetical protein